MQVEIKIALNFVLNFLYNKLPRRRVNLFGEELESALRDKFQDHWYPDKPFKGSAFRCLKITDPADPVLNRAARESGNPVSEIIDTLPADLAVWIDPGEVSYRIGEKGSVHILYSARENAAGFDNDFQGLVNGIENLNFQPAAAQPPPAQQQQQQPPPPPQQQQQQPQPPQCNNQLFPNFQQPPPPVSPGIRRPQQQITYTAGTFAQTKFGSTKLKTNSKKTARMSPTEFSNYIKQRAIVQQQQRQYQHHQWSPPQPPVPPQAPSHPPPFRQSFSSPGGNPGGNLTSGDWSNFRSTSPFDLWNSGSKQPWSNNTLENLINLSSAQQQQQMNQQQFINDLFATSPASKLDSGYQSGSPGSSYQSGPSSASTTPPAMPSPPIENGQDKGNKAGQNPMIEAILTQHMLMAN